ncbi:MAG: hypothetical protein H7062_04245 [Candidatus Saccharimonas sp.]|nr:hypothetical protein [Planctomycetaceae bacterium]
MNRSRRWISIGLVLVGACVGVDRSIRADEVPSPRWRRPVALAVVEEGRRLVTANQRGGSMSLLDPNAMKFLREVSVGKQLSDVTDSPTDRSLLLVTDEESHELVAIRRIGDDLTVRKRLGVNPYPVTVRVSADGTRAFVASLWSRTITIVDLASWLGDAAELPKGTARTIRLPFAPREMLFVEAANKLIVADAFGSKLAVVDPVAGRVESVRDLPAHGIRQLRLHPTKPRLVLTHQMLSRMAHTTFDDVHWGGLMVNCLRSLPLADVLDPKLDPLKGSDLEYLGGPERGAGDPAGFVMRPDGVIAVALSGTNELVLDDGNHLFAKRLKMEERPTAVALSPDGLHAFVVNTLSDSVTVVHLARRDIVGTISLGPTPEPSAADRGERLFHSARLSHDSWFSCASCHVDGHTNGLLNDNFTDGTFGTAKRVLSLRGVADTAPYAWSGRFESLADQIKHSIKSTMQGEALSNEQTSDLETYLRTLPPAPPVGSPDQTAVTRGAALFERLDCARCHARPAFTSPRLADVKLKDEQGLSKFNPPSLRGISQNSPYFHDGRAATLDDVFTKFIHQLESELPSSELNDLLAYLNSL